MDTLIKFTLDTELQKVLELFEADDGRSFEEKKEEAARLLQTVEEPALADVLVDAAAADATAADIKQRFRAAGEHIYADGGLCLREVNESDRDGYLAIQQEYYPIKEHLQHESSLQFLWNGHTSPKTLALSILHDETYVGYCCINDLTKSPWEIAIELLPAWTRRGIGYAAIRAMLHALYERLGVTEYRVRIEPTNLASRQLFEKLGAVPAGVSEFWLHDKKKLKQYEEENLSSIDENLTALAAEFGVEPRTLLSHVLEYRLTRSPDTEDRT